MKVILIPNSPLESEPIDAQLTLHKDNYEAQKGEGTFVGAVYGECDSVITNLILHYGFSRILQFIDEYKIAG